jgi:DNA mismatch endonuclease, patch repair protein
MIGNANGFSVSSVLRKGQVGTRSVADQLSRKERSALMSRIHGRDTLPERLVCRELRRRRIYFTRHCGDLPGKPDVVFRRCRLAVFIDGEFWHGRHFDAWKNGLSAFWLKKISSNIRRDQRSRRRLNSAGWHAIRLWGRDVQKDPIRSVERVLAARDRLISRNRNVE